MRPWVLRYREAVIRLTITMNYVLLSINRKISATQMIALPALNSPGHMYRCQRFTSAPRTDVHDSRRYVLGCSFITQEFHPLHFTS